MSAFLSEMSSVWLWVWVCAAVALAVAVRWAVRGMRGIEVCGKEDMQVGLAGVGVGVGVGVVGRDLSRWDWDWDLLPTRQKQCDGMVGQCNWGCYPDKFLGFSKQKGEDFGGWWW
jgi:hypothetical protein